MILTHPYTHKLHLLFDSLHILRQLLYCACAVFRLDFRLYQFLWVFLPCNGMTCMDIHIGFHPVVIAFIPAIFKYRGNFAFWGLPPHKAENQHSPSIMIFLNELNSSPSAVSKPRKLFPASISAPCSTWFANSSISGAKSRYDCINCFICQSAFRKILELLISSSNSSNFLCVVDFLWFRTRMSASSPILSVDSFSIFSSSFATLYSATVRSWFFPFFFSYYRFYVEDASGNLV